MTGHERSQRDPRSNAALLALARRYSKRYFARYDGQPAFMTAVVALHSRGTRDVFDSAVALTRDPERHRRSLGCLLIGELDPDGGTTFDERQGALVALLKRERTAEVRTNALTALGHLHGGTVDAAGIARFVSDRSAAVRGALAFALAGTASAAGIAAQLVLMEDRASVEAHDWATTGIGLTLSNDGPKIRRALLRRVNDDDEIVRYEALHGLARRHDPRVAPLLIAALQREDMLRDAIFVQAASEMVFGDEHAAQTVAEALAALRRFRPEKRR